MSILLRVAQVIDRPLAKVFHFYADEHVLNHPRWNPDLQLEQISDGPIGVGTTIRRRNTSSGRPVDGTMEVVEFEPGQSFGVVIREGDAETRGRATFEAESPERTLLTISGEFPDMNETSQSLVKGLMERSAQNIKQLIESEVDE